MLLEDLDPDQMQIDLINDLNLNACSGLRLLKPLKAIYHTEKQGGIQKY